MTEEIRLGDIIQTRKKHPCGQDEWTVIRTGADIKIRCLLAVLALSESFDVVASKDVAQLLGVKRPTIHRSLEMLQQKGLIHKEPYGDIHLTDAGREQAQRMERQRDDLSLLFARRYGLPAEESVRAAFALMSALSADSLARLQ